MTVPTHGQLLDNLLLSRLTDQDLTGLVPLMSVMNLKNGDCLQQAGQDVVDTWFPCGSAMAAFCVGMPEGDRAVEVALVGREGAIGGIVSNGNAPSYTTARVLYPGRFLRVKIAALEQAKLDSISLRHWFSRYSDCLLAQVFQTAACNARHTVTQRTAKWLLAAASRTGQADFIVTQRQLAEMLGAGAFFCDEDRQPFSRARHPRYTARHLHHHRRSEAAPSLLRLHRPNRESLRHRIEWHLSGEMRCGAVVVALRAKSCLGSELHTGRRPRWR